MQISLNFAGGPAAAFESCRQFVAHRAQQQGRMLSAIAGDMGYSLSHLSRKLGQNKKDTARFTLDDFENYIQITGDVEPIHYLVEKYIGSDPSSEIEELQDRIAQLEGRQPPRRVKAKS